MKELFAGKFAVGPLSASRMSIAALLSFMLLGAAMIPVSAEGFPGKGDRVAYAESLPHYNLGNRYLQKGWWEKAIEKYNDAIAIYPYDADVYINLGMALRRSGNLAGSVEAFRKACDLNPDDWMTWSNLGNILMLQERFPESLEVFARAMKCKIPDAEKVEIEKNVDGIKKIMKAKGMLAAPAPSPAVRAAARSKKSPKRSAPALKSPAAGSSLQPAAAPAPHVDSAGYDAWLGGASD